MVVHNFLCLAVTCIALFGTLSKTQLPAAIDVTNGTIPFDPFLDDEEFEKDYSFIISFKFHIREEMLPQLFTEIATQNIPCAFQDCNISLLDIVEATQISRFTSQHIAEAINELHINPNNVYAIPTIYNITPDSVESFLQIFGLKFSDIYGRFLDSLSSPIQTIPDVLNILNVSVIDFMNAGAYGNDTVKLHVLATGNYSQANVNAVLNVTNKTATDLLKLVPLNEMAKQLKKLNSYEFTMFLEILGITTLNLLDFYQYLNITPINFLSHPPFINIVSNYYDLLNPEEVLGIFVSNNKVVTSNKAKALKTYQNQDTDILKNYVNFHAELVENPLVQYAVKNVTLKNPGYQSQQIGHVEIQNDVVIEFPEISTDYNKTTLNNCTYITTLPFGGLHAENLNPSQLILENYMLLMNKTNNTLYNLGSPLFCSDKLYGIATEDSAKQIKFSTFIKQVPGTATTATTIGSVATTNNGTTSRAVSNTIISYNIFNLLLALFVLKISL